MGFLETIWTEMAKGNFSFAILIVGALQLVVMLISLTTTVLNLIILKKSKSEFAKSERVVLGGKTYYKSYDVNGHLIRKVGTTEFYTKVLDPANNRHHYKITEMFPEDINIQQTCTKEYVKE